ncbi:MAG: DUF4384 domain-containing protein [Gemmatimonadetes bacterium]|nr:DUF4384 domain-containing protein [Gemmatimonadota bacterium]
MDRLEARVWLDRGDEPVLRRGERVRVYYRSTEDAFVAILNIDTDGTTRLLFPRSPDENHYVRGGRDYRLIFPNSAEWHVEDRPGMGYFFIVASREPFDFSALRYSRFDGGWDMSLVGRKVYTDPYVAVDDLVARLIPDWEYADSCADNPRGPPNSPSKEWRREHGPKDEAFTDRAYHPRAPSGHWLSATDQTYQASGDRQTDARENEISVRPEAREEATPRGCRIGCPVPTNGVRKHSRRTRSPAPLGLVIFLGRRT